MKIRLMLQPVVIDFLDRVILRPDMTVFEWGMGGSTGWLAERVKSIVSVEHDEAWFKLVPPAPNLTRRLVPGERGVIIADPSDPNSFFSDDARWIDLNFRKYVDAIEGQFDFISVDGVARASCLARAVGHVRRGGFLMLDDSQRAYYTRHTGHLFHNWDQFSFMEKKTETTIWRRT